MQATYVNDLRLETTPMTNDEAYDGFLKIAENIAAGVEFPKKPFNQLTLDDIHFHQASLLGLIKKPDEVSHISWENLEETHFRI
jgi:hypothetical protein